jgi:uncharacterized protein
VDAHRVDGEFVFITSARDDLPSLATVVEPEGTSHVLRRADADALGFTYDVVAAWLTVSTQTSLDELGITARLSRALADRGISCNVIAGHHHDHLLVPVDRCSDALDALRDA